MNRLCVVGLGYIGLPTASMFASRGLEVIGDHVRPDVVARSMPAMRISASRISTC